MSADNPTTVAEAEAAYRIGLKETLEDQPHLDEDTIAADLVTSVAIQMSDPRVAREFCVTMLGFVPVDAQRWLDQLSAKGGAK